MYVHVCMYVLILWVYYLVVITTKKKTNKKTKVHRETEYINSYADVHTRTYVDALLNTNVRHEDIGSFVKI